MLPEHEWLTKAQALPVGTRIRVKHRNERRNNLVICNDRECWWAYCQACKEGARLDKVHVMLNAPTVIESPKQGYPHDAAPLYGNSDVYAEHVERFLIKKNMALEYLWDYNPEFSMERKRLLLSDASWQAVGRDVTEKSNAKWVEYGSDMAAFFAKGGGSTAILCEDTFSAIKVRWALDRHEVKDYAAIACLGTDIQPKLAELLCEYNHLLWFFDDDDAGWSGISRGVKYMRPFVSGQSILTRKGDKCDPKDLTVAALYERIAPRMP